MSGKQAGLTCSLASVESILPLRSRLLLPDAPMHQAVFPQDREEATLHPVVYQGESLLAIATLFPNRHGELPFPKAWQLRGMAVLPAARGQGIGRLLLGFALQKLRAKGADLVWCHAREESSGFYQACGFVLLPELVEIPPVGSHYVAHFQLNIV